MYFAMTSGGTSAIST